MWNPETTVKTGTVIRKKWRMRILVSIMFLMGMAILTNCGGSGKLQIKDVSVIEKESDLPEFFKIIDGTYGLIVKSVGTLSGDKIEISTDIEFKKLKETDGYNLDFKDFYAIFKDKNGQPIKDDIGDDVKAHFYNIDDLMHLPIGERVKLPLGYYLPNNDVKKNILSNAVTFDIYCKVMKEKPKFENSSDENFENSSDENWDAVLKSYEDYIDKCIKLAKKASSGDISAISEYAGILEKAEELQTQLEKASGDLSAAQASKLLKLQTKLANAAASMY
jgi:hypothetical protein